MSGVRAFDALAEAPRWTAWRNELRGGKKTKIPYSPHGGMTKADDPSTWGCRAEAETTAKRIVNGLGGGIGIELGEHELGNREPERAPNLAGQQLRRQRPCALAGATELEHVQSIVVGLDDRGQGAPLAQRRHVAGHADGPEHHYLDVIVASVLSLRETTALSGNLAAGHSSLC